jgi:hypothetical protein
VDTRPALLDLPLPYGFIFPSLGQNTSHAQLAELTGVRMKRSLCERAAMPVNINQATPEELDSVAGLEGHGFEIARYREEPEASRACGSLPEFLIWQAGAISTSSIFQYSGDGRAPSFIDAF